MTRTLLFSFDELPLVIHNGIPAAFVNGTADIAYSADGFWHIETVSVEGFGERVNGKRQWPQVPAPAALTDIIVQRLEGEWAGKVVNAINEQIEEDRISAADDMADARRDRLMTYAGPY